MEPHARSSEVTELFPPADYRFRVGVRRGDVPTFFAPTARHAEILAERRHWLEASPERYVQCTERGGPLLAAFHALATAWDHVGAVATDCHALGGALEPDFLLLARGDDGEFRLEGGALCFPTAWSLEETIGRSVDWIHGPVPGLNAALGPAITRVLSGLGEHGPLERLNWGLAATPERNLHPALARPPLQADCAPDSVWLRIEHQLLAALPAGGTAGILFAIRIELIPFAEILANPAIRRGFAHALATMPAEVAAYKRVAAARPRLLDLCAV